MITGWIGKKGSGKSYMMAKCLIGILNRNRDWFEKGHTEIMRKVYIDFPINADILEEFKLYLRTWDDLSELPSLKDCDVFADDITARFDSRIWHLLSFDIREWLRVSERLGCDFYFNAQDFSHVEKTFRDLTDLVFHCTKQMGSDRPTITKPKIKRIWGIIRVAEVDEQDFRKLSFDQSRYLGEGKMNWISKKYCHVYDHAVVIKHKELPLLQCIIRTAQCGKIIHSHK